MAHTFVTQSGTTVLHNGDFSGNVVILPCPSLGDPEISIPFSDIKELYAEYVKGIWQTRIETRTTTEMLEFGEDTLPEHRCCKMKGCPNA